MTRHRPRRASLLPGTGVGLAIVVALLAAGCDSEPQAAETTPTAAPTAAPTEVASATPTGQPTREPTEQPTLEPPNEPEPELATTGDDLDAVVRNRHAYRSWLFRNPHPKNATARLKRITHPECNCWEPDHTLLTHYAENELWWTGAALQPVSVEDIDRKAQNIAIVGVVYERDGPAELIDRTGRVHDELEPTRYYIEVVLVRKGVNAPWRFKSVSDVRPPPDEEGPEREG